MLRVVGGALMIACGSLAASCAPSLRDGQFTCSDGECPAAMRCCAGECRRSCEDPLDAGAEGTDAGPTVDAGHDAAVDAGPTDAGVDAGPGPECSPPCPAGETCGHVGICVRDDTVPSCLSCARDVQCRGAAACVAEEVGVGRCLPTPSESGCEGPIYTARADRPTTAMELATVCSPPEGVSCDAVLAAINETFCTDDAMCPSGGICDTARTVCSHFCEAREDCSEGLVCVSRRCSAP